MRLITLDVVMPSLLEMLESIVRYETTSVILLFVLELLAAVAIVIFVVLRKQGKDNPNSTADSEYEESEQS